MPPYRSVLCAVDRSDLAARVFSHAVGLATAAGARLSIVHVGDRADDLKRELELERAFYDAVPYGATYLQDPEITFETGDVVNAILKVADERACDLIVCGSHGRGGLARLLVGSTTTALLQRTTRPTLIVPSGQLDIVTLELEGVFLHFGRVIAAVDLAEHNQAQLAMASGLAGLANQELMLLTVVHGDGPSDHDAAHALRERAHGLTPVHPRALIVRRGEIAQEIARGAVAEHSGLVVLGLRKASEHRGKPGAIANEVLQTGRALVLAVPGA